MYILSNLSFKSCFKHFSTFLGEYSDKIQRLISRFFLDYMNFRKKLSKLCYKINNIIQIKIMCDIDLKTLI